MPYMQEILSNMHNYFDCVINYVICKMENGDFISSITSLVFEAKNDNQIHMESLKGKANLTRDNYQELLFGPDKELLNYDFEIVDSE